jgi:6-phosphogluconolactonase
VSPDVRIAPDGDAFRRIAAEILERAILDAVGSRGTCSIALSGGSTPAPVYEELGAAALPWERLEVWFADERAVPMDHPESNYDLVRRTLLRGRPEARPRLHRMPADAADREAAAADYARRLPDPLDVLVLGMGPDGHTASLFPGSPLVSERSRKVVAVHDAPKPPPERMSLAAPAIEGARAAFVLATGAGKAAMLARALDPRTDPREVPAALARRAVWIVDAAAAAGLRG